MLRQLPGDVEGASWSGLQKPLHSGPLASPHAVVRHSQAPPEVTAEQCPPSLQVPSQRRESELKSQGPEASVVVVVEPIVAVPRVAGAHRNCAAPNLTILVPPN